MRSSSGQYLDQKIVFNKVLEYNKSFMSFRAQHIKYVFGRKTDVYDSGWLYKLGF